MSGQPLWITEHEVTQVLDLPQAIEALERGLASEAAGDAKNMTKTHAVFGNGDTLHAIGAVFTGEGIVGTKTWAHTEGGASPLLILYDAHDGSIRAIIEAFALGQLRTASMTAVGTRRMARADADDLAMIGTGKQSLAQVAAVVAVRPIRRIRVFSPNEERRERFAAKVRDAFGIPTEAPNNVADTVRDAAVITCATRATEAFLFSKHVARGAHINAVGAIVNSRIEFEPALLERCGAIAVDAPDSVQRLSAEFRTAFGAPEGPGWKRVRPISALVAEGASRPPDADLTLFKAMGMGVSDLALGTGVLRRITERGGGRPFAAPKRSALDFSNLRQSAASR